MSELNNRIEAQRRILQIVNRWDWPEELYGLSSGAIERWLKENSISPSTDLARAIYLCAEKLFFLSNKSQEQVTEEYLLLSNEVAQLTQDMVKIMDALDI